MIYMKLYNEIINAMVTINNRMKNYNLKVM